jgi:hypothetical protein
MIAATSLSMAALLGAHLQTKHSKDLIPDPFVAPAAKVPVDGAPGWQIMGHESPRTAATQDVQDGIDNLASLIDGRAAFQ